MAGPKHVAKRKKPKSRSARAGLMLAVSRVHKMLRGGSFSPRVASTAAVYLTACIEYLAAEVLELAAEVAKANNRSRLTPRHVMLAVRNDSELGQLLDHVTIKGSGVLPRIPAALLPPKSRKKPDTSSQEY